jgi:hypothetical protein
MVVFMTVSAQPESPPPRNRALCPVHRQDSHAQRRPHSGLQLHDGGVDKHLIDFLELIRPHSSNGCFPASSGPKDEAARERFLGRLQEMAAKRGVATDSLPSVSTWADVIELDECRL